jgi:hypothetical protein
MKIAGADDMDGKPAGVSEWEFVNQFQRRCWFGFVARQLQRSTMCHKPLMMHQISRCSGGCVSRSLAGAI